MGKDSQFGNQKPQKVSTTEHPNLTTHSPFETMAIVNTTKQKVFLVSKSTFPSYLRATDRYLMITQSTSVSLLYYAMMMGIIYTSFAVSLWAILGLLLGFAVNGTNYQLGCLFDHITNRKTLNEEQLAQYVNSRPSAIHIGFTAVVTGWSLHLAHTDTLMLVIAFAGLWGILSLIVLQTFIDKSVVSDSET